MEPSTALREGIITAIQLQQRQKSRVNIFLDGEFAFGLDAEVVLRHRLKKGAALSVEDQQHLLFEEDSKAALNRAFQLLGRRNYSEQEIRRKLELARFHEEIIERTIARCRELGYLDDAMFARDFIKTQLARRPQGKLRLRPALLRKGVSAKLADEILGEFLASVDTTRLVEEAAEKFLARRSKTAPAEKLRKRLADHLLRAGFTWEDIQCLPLWRKLSDFGSMSDGENIEEKS
jgi:regulatory protein